MHRPYYILLIVAFMIASCSRGHSDSTFSPDDQFTDYYAHLLILKEEGKLLMTDSTHMNMRIDSLRIAFHMTKGYVDSTVSTYQSDLQRWRQFYDLVIKRLEVIQREESNHSVQQRL
jgi:hypothetical protein